MRNKLAAIEKLDPEGYRLLTAEELCGRIDETDTQGVARAEVCRRPCNPNRLADRLAFGWLCPGNVDERADAFDGLMACCWNATEKRIYPYGLFPDGYSKGREAIVRDLSDAIKTALVDRLQQMASLTPHEIAKAALTGGFKLDAQIANPIRRRRRHEPEICSFEDLLTASDQQEEQAPALLEILPDDPETRANPYNEAAELITAKRGEIETVLGKRGWRVLLEFSELEDNNSLPEGEREREALLTRLFERVFNVAERQARTHKARFRSCFQAAVEAGHPVIARIAELLGWEWRTT